MAIEPCRECKAEVSTDAAACPKCGKRNPTAKPTGASMVVILGLAFIILFSVWFVFALVSHTPEPTQKRTVTLSRSMVVSGDDRFGCIDVAHYRAVAAIDDHRLTSKVGDKDRVLFMRGQCRRIGDGREVLASPEEDGLVIVQTPALEGVYWTSAKSLREK